MTCSSIRQMRMQRPLGLIFQKSMEEGGGGGCLVRLASCKLATITTRRLPPLPTNLQLLVHCNYFCIVFVFALHVCFALELILHCKYCCIAIIIFALQ